MQVLLQEKFPDFAIIPMKTLSYFNEVMCSEQKDNIIHLKKPAAIKDLLTEVIRNGARDLLAAAIESEVVSF